MSIVKEVGGKLANVVVGHFPEKNTVEDLDVCSMEADIQTENDIVADVNEISGIALGNSRKEHPAFAGAVRLATVQCFEEDTEDKTHEREDMPEDRKLTFEDIRRGVRELNIFPWQLYSLDDIKNDKNYGKLFEENATLKAENERLTGENKDIKEKSEGAVRAADIITANKTIDEILGEGHTEKQVKFIKGRFDPKQMEDLSEEGIKSFVENAKKEFADTAKLFGVAESQSTPGAGGPDESEDATRELEEEALKELGIVDKEEK